MASIAEPKITSRIAVRSASLAAHAYIIVDPSDNPSTKPTPGRKRLML
jgi:hypothetical protein